MCLSIKEEEQFSETVKEFPVLYDKAVKGYKEKERRGKSSHQRCSVERCS